MSDEPASSDGEPAIGRQIGPFRLVRTIGEGGMGVVFEAEDLRLRRRVALKILPPALTADPARRRRLLREARSGSAAKHPSIAAVFEVGEADGAVYLAMELVRGETLRALLSRKGGSLPVEEAIGLVASAARGLAKAHEAGVVHRDLKPENIMISEDGTIKILDFGLAKMRAPETREELEIAPTITDTVTMEGRVVLGTPSYMAPEQAKGRAVDARADIFSLGVMLYELLAGRRPFRGETAMEIIISVDRDDPPAASSVNTTVPAAVDAILSRCLAKRPDSRYSSVDELASALENALWHLPRASRGNRARGLGVISIAVAGGIAGLVFFLTKDSSRALDAPFSAVNSAAASAEARPLRHPCEKGVDEATAKCGPKETAWCDVNERVIACCGEGRVAVGRGGLCECPAGGCDPSAWKPLAPEEIQKVVRAAFGDLRACYAVALQKVPNQGGTVAIGFELTPDGDVFRARVSATTFPDTEMQACALRLIRSLKFPPPPSGTGTVDYPVRFSAGDE